MTATPAPVPQYSPLVFDELLWYFGPGQAFCESSWLGGMLAHAAAFGGVCRAVPQEPVLTAEGVCIGWRSAISARPTAEVRTAVGFIPDDRDMRRAARISRVMLQVERQSRQAATVIALFFGESGNRWALATNAYGRLGAVFHLTRKGQALLDATSKDTAHLQLNPQQRMETLAIMNKLKPVEARTNALRVCNVQAERLETEARSVWHEVRQRLKAQSS